MFLISVLKLKERTEINWSFASHMKASDGACALAINIRKKTMELVQWDLVSISLFSRLICQEN